MFRATNLLLLFILLATLASAAILPQAVPHLHQLANSAVPVPGSYGLLCLGLSGLVFALRRRA